jgi:hypothetical protein
VVLADTALLLPFCVRDGALGQLHRADVLASWPRRTAYFRTAPWRGTWRARAAAS